MERFFNRIMPLLLATALFSLLCACKDEDYGAISVSPIAGYYTHHYGQDAKTVKLTLNGEELPYRTVYVETAPDNRSAKIILYDAVPGFDTFTILSAELTQQSEYSNQLHLEGKEGTVSYKGTFYCSETEVFLTLDLTTAPQ